MNFDFGKKMLMAGFVTAAVSSFGALGKIPALHTMLNILATLMLVGGFALMWRVGGNILHLAVAGACAVGCILSFIFPVANLLISIITSIYLLIWAFKRFTDGDMMWAVIIGGCFIVSVAFRPLLGLLYDLGIELTVASMLINIIFAGANSFAAYTESEK